MLLKTTVGFGLGLALAGSAVASTSSAAQLSLANAQAAQSLATPVGNLSVCPEGQNWISLADGSKLACCPVNEAKIVLPDGSERACAAATPKVGKGLGFFGYAAIGLLASGGAAAVAQGSQGRPGSP